MKNEPVEVYKSRVEKLKEEHGIGKNLIGECNAENPCKRCIREKEKAQRRRKYQKEYYKKNKMKILAAQKRWQTKHREYFNAYHALYEQLNRKKIRKQKRAYRKKNIAKVRVWQRRWYEKHKNDK